MRRHFVDGRGREQEAITLDQVFGNSLPMFGFIHAG
jgi:hypothetical protein